MKNENGQSMVGVLMALAISGVLTMTVLDLNSIMMKSNTTAQANSDVLAYVNIIRTNLAVPELATKMLKNQPIIGPVTVYDPLLGSVMSKAGVRQQATDAWFVRQVWFENPVESSTPGTYRLTLVLVIGKDLKRIYGPDYMRKVVGDVYCSTNAGVITNCSISAPERSPATEESQNEHSHSGCNN